MPYLTINFVMKIKFDVGLSTYLYACPTISLSRLTAPPKLNVLEVNITV